MIRKIFQQSRHIINPYNSTILPSQRLFSSDPKETIFDKIINKQIKADIVYQDDRALAFRDVAPKAPTHILVIPKIKGKLSRLINADQEDKDILGHLMYVSALVARQEKLEKGWRLVVNNGQNANQTVFHLHLHVMGGRSFTWPPG